jgi:hypothetical protein
MWVDPIDRHMHHAPYNELNIRLTISHEFRSDKFKSYRFYKRRVVILAEDRFKSNRQESDQNFCVKDSTLYVKVKTATASATLL